MNTGDLPADRQPIAILLHGASGRMGQALLRLTADDPSMRIAAAASQTVGQRVVDGIPQFRATELENVPAFDVAIDFSMPAAFNSILALCLERGVPLVCGTTGLDCRIYPHRDAVVIKLQPRRGCTDRLGRKRSARATGLGLRHRRVASQKQAGCPVRHGAVAGPCRRARRSNTTLCIVARRGHRR
jgi:hypothetical protein